MTLTVTPEQVGFAILAWLIVSCVRAYLGRRVDLRLTQVSQVKQETPNRRASDRRGFRG